VDYCTEYNIIYVCEQFRPTILHIATSAAPLRHKETSVHHSTRIALLLGDRQSVSVVDLRARKRCCMCEMMTGFLESPANNTVDQPSLRTRFNPLTPTAAIRVQL